MLNILYLEDYKTDFDLTKKELEKSLKKVSITHAQTIEEACAIINDKPIFDIAILDLNLPDGSGIDVLIEIRKLNLPTAVIILTGTGHEDSAIVALKAGADDYIVKTTGYLKKLGENIYNAIKNFKRNIEKISKPIRVLYVEWNKSDIDLTQRHIRKYAPHIHIETVPTAEEALDLLAENKQAECPSIF